MSANISIQVPSIRPLDPRRDLLAVADLIEICFSKQMDAEGRDYLKNLRRIGREPEHLRWISVAGERVSYPMHGYVWLEDGRIVGNLSLIPFFREGTWRYLIANVAVHPDFQRRGIARQLTQKALQYVQEHGVSSVWLQVREENEIALRLYHSLGFEERARRTTWLSNSTEIRPGFDHGIKVFPRLHTDWPQQAKWLRLTYPPEVAWYLPFYLNRFKPSLWRKMINWLGEEQSMHWSARCNGELIGVATWEHSRSAVDNLWLAVNPQAESPGIQTLLQHIRHSLPRWHSLQVNYPAGHAEKAFINSGFDPHNVLIWMEINFKKSNHKPGQPASVGRQG